MREKILILSFLGYAFAQFELFNSTEEYEHDGFDENDNAGISYFWDFSYTDFFCKIFYVTSKLGIFTFG